MYEAPRESRARVDLLAEDSVVTSAGEEIIDPLGIATDTPGRQTGEKMRHIPHAAPFREPCPVARDPSADKNGIADAGKLIEEIERIDTIVKNAVPEHGIIAA